MKTFLNLLVLIFAVVFCTASPKGKLPENSRTVSFDADWLFLKGNPSGAENPSFDDSGWRKLDLPHDWSIEDLPGQIPDSIVGPFSKASVGKMSTGYTIGGTAWYRKHFTLNRKEEGKVAYLRFDGVYMNADVWVNGQHVGFHPYGYTSFYYYISPYLNPAGQDNVIAVQVKNEGRNARWYSGSGIYRHTWLTIVNPVHIGEWGVFVKTLKVNENSADLEVAVTIENFSPENLMATLQVEILDPSGQTAGMVKEEIPVPRESPDIKHMLVSVPHPQLWSPETPEMYKVRVTISRGKKVLDRTTVPFGIRTIHISAKTGMLLNGKPVELKGGCFHHDNGPLGAAIIDRAEERKIEILKKAGYNAIRCSHNPPSPELLDVCDRLGILVMDEIFDNWEKEKVSPEDYSKDFKEWWQRDLRSMIMRDRNHPSVFLWSVGNEIREALDTAGLTIITNLVKDVKRLDPTRGVTEALMDFSGRRGEASHWDAAAPHMALLDVTGYNYLYSRYEADHEKHPDRVMVATEFMPLYALENWQMVEKHPYVIGNFAWVCMDYLGEAGVGLSRIVPDAPAQSGSGQGMLGGGFFSRDSWPVFNDYQGDIDLIGNEKPRYRHQLVVWRQSKVEILVHRPLPKGMKENVSPWGWPDELKSWSWPGQEGEKMQVHVYTRSKLVKLELNGKPVGEQAVDGEKSVTATFEVPYEPGTLVARVFDDGKEVASETLKTTGKPAKIRLTADRNTIKADRNDLSYVMVEITDEEGNVVPWADGITVNFAVTGQGSLAGVGNGSPSDMDSFQKPKRRTFHGRCLAIMRPEKEAGVIRVKATSVGLKEAEVKVEVE